MSRVKSLIIHNHETMSIKSGFDDDLLNKILSKNSITSENIISIAITKNESGEHLLVFYRT